MLLTGIHFNTYIFFLWWCQGKFCRKFFREWENRWVKNHFSTFWVIWNLNGNKSHDIIMGNNSFSLIRCFCALLLLFLVSNLPLRGARERIIRCNKSSNHITKSSSITIWGIIIIVFICYPYMRALFLLYLKGGGNLRDDYFKQRFLIKRLLKLFFAKASNPFFSMASSLH